MAGVNTSINNLKCREGKKKWKTTRKAVSAAEQKVVESTATQVKDQESHVQVHVALKEFSERTVKEEALAATDQEEASEKVQSVQEELSVRVLREALEIVQEEASEKAQREEASVATDQEEALVRVQTVQEDHLARVLKEEASVVTDQEEALAKAQREEASATESQADSETLARRASLREISTTSVTSRRAESTR